MSKQWGEYYVEYLEARWSAEIAPAELCQKATKYANWKLKELNPVEEEDEPTETT